MLKMYKWNITTGKGIEQAIGTKPYKHKGIHFFINRSLNNKNKYVATELSTGLAIISECENEKQAVEQAKRVIDQKTPEFVLSLLAETLEKRNNKEPLNYLDKLTPAEILYLKHNNTGRVIKSYELKDGYYEITEEKYEKETSITDRYFINTNGRLDHATKEWIRNNPERFTEILNKMQKEGWQEIDKKTYESKMVEQCKTRLLNYINNNAIGDLIHVVTNNSNKYSIKAMEEIIGFSLPPQTGKRENVLIKWLGEKYINWKVNKEIDEERKREYERRQEEKELQEKINAAEKAFMAGEFINAEQFTLLCKYYEIKLPLKTHGWVNKHLVSIRNDGSYTYYNSKSNVISNYAKELWQAIKTVDEFFAKPAI